MSDALKKEIEQQLQSRLDPAKGKLSGVALQGGKVYVTLEVDAGQGPQLEPFRLEAEQIVTSIKGVSEAVIILTAENNAPPAAASSAASRMASKALGKGAGMQAAHKISSRPVAPQVKYMVAVASGKGGVGKSTVAANLALAFAALGKKTGLLDADIYGASQPMMMGTRQRPDTNAGDMIVPLEVHGVKFVSIGLFVEQGAPIVWRGPMVHSAIQQLFRDVDWGALDVLVIDLPPGTGDAQLSLAQYVPLSGAVIVSTPQDVALQEAIKGLRMFEKTHVPILGIIENMSHFECPACHTREDIFGHGGAKKTAAREKVPFLGEIPLISAIRIQGDAGVPIVAAAPLSPAAEAFKNIAARLWITLPEQNRKTG